MKVLFKKIRPLLWGLALSGFFNGCKEPDDLGINVLPVSDLSSLNIADTFSLQTTIVREDSIPSSNTSNSLLGAINDNVFGSSNAGFYTQVLLNSISLNPNFGTNPVCDSIVLTLDYTGYYGDTTSEHSFTVSELSEDIHADSVYYSNKNFSISNTLGTLQTSDIHPADSIVLNGVVSDPHLRIKLDNTLGARFLDPANAGNLSDNTTFLNFFKGIYVSDVIISGSGTILYFGLTKSMSKISLFYHNDAEDSLQYDFLLNGTGKINHYSHDYSSAAFYSDLNIPHLNSDFCYVQSLAGIKTKIELPFLNNLIQNGNISINKAEIITNLDNSSTATYAANPSLFLVGIDTAGKSYFLPDFIESTTGFGGTLTSNSYTFLITRYIQQILSGTRTNNGLFLVSSGAASSAYRTIVGGSGNSTLKMKLRIQYTILNP